MTGAPRPLDTTGVIQAMDDLRRMLGAGDAQMTRFREERDAARRDLAAARAELVRLRAALEHYAAEDRWIFALSPRFSDKYVSEVTADRVSVRGPDVARAALTDAADAGPRETG